eukprot:3670819-Rhodomonas_salina.3
MKVYARLWSRIPTGYLSTRDATVTLGSKRVKTEQIKRAFNKTVWYPGTRTSFINVFHSAVAADWIKRNTHFNRKFTTSSTTEAMVSVMISDFHLSSDMTPSSVPSSPRLKATQLKRPSL